MVRVKQKNEAFGHNRRLQQRKNIGADRSFLHRKVAKKQGCKDREDVIFPHGHRPAPHSGNPDITRAEVARFDRYLDSHPAVARALERNPDLVRNQAFLERNPSLRTWLSKHPETAEEVRETPGQFLFARTCPRGQPGRQALASTAESHALIH